MLVRLLEEINKVTTWTHAGYYLQAVHLDANVWLNIHRPRPARFFFHCDYQIITQSYTAVQGTFSISITVLFLSQPPELGLKLLQD